MYFGLRKGGWTIVQPATSEPSPPKPVTGDLILEALESENPAAIIEVCRSAHPGDIEAAFEQLDDEDREQVLQVLPVEVLSELSDYLPAADIERRLGTLPAEEQREVLESMSDDELVDLLQEVPAKQRPEYLELLPEDKQEVSAELLRYPEHTAGGRMTTAFATIRDSMTIRQALEQLSELQEEAEVLSRIYVVDKEGRLTGKTRLRDLAFNPRSMHVSEITDDDQIGIEAMADQEDAAQMLARYDLVALPVLDPQGRPIGVITHDDALEIIEEEHTEDVEKASGIGGEHPDLAYLQTPVGTHFRRRFPWVLGLAFLALSSGVVMLSYEEVLQSHYVLALYLPMVVAAGGNTGSQAATMVIRAMSLGELRPKSFFRVIWKESRIGLLVGSLLGLAVALQIRFALPIEALDVEPNAPLGHLSLVVGLALSAQIVTSNLIGASLPILARTLRLDPAVVASPAITTLVDVTGMALYFTVARALLPF